MPGVPVGHPDRRAPMRVLYDGACGGLAAGRVVALAEDPVDQAVLDGLVGLEEAVALHVDVDLLVGLAAVLRVNRIDAGTQFECLAGVDLDVGRLTLEAA